MYIQLFPIYGVMFGVNYWNSKMDGDDGSVEVEHLFQIIIGIIGISFHYWKED